MIVAADYLPQEQSFSEFLGAPDLVVEVVSPSSVVKDTRKLRIAYHAADIPSIGSSMLAAGP